MKVAITGSDGFLGWHLKVRMTALGRHQLVPVTRTVMTNTASLSDVLSDVDAVVHLAGVNRGDPDAVEGGNIVAAESLVEALEAAGTSPVVVYANSVHAGADTPYGRSKFAAAAILEKWASRASARLVDLRLPNLFGEGGRPEYNSFVATFCHRLANGESPRIDVDRKLPLLHAQDAAASIIDLLQVPASPGPAYIEGQTVLVSDIASQLGEIASIYARGDIPDLSDPLVLRLFNTYRHHLHPASFPRVLDERADERGSFFEVLRSWGGQGQTSFSTTKPGVTRGNHFHLRKVERFTVVAGEAEIRIRPVGGTEIATFRLSGRTPAYVDMPTLHTHSITNVGDSELLTSFWISEIYDPTDGDTFPEPVL